jgi:hypothetical protein
VQCVRWKNNYASIADPFDALKAVVFYDVWLFAMIDGVKVFRMVEFGLTQFHHAVISGFVRLLAVHRLSARHAYRQ